MGSSLCSSIRKFYSAASQTLKYEAPPSLPPPSPPPPPPPRCNNNHSHSRPADVLISNWALGKTAACDISVSSPLNSNIMSEAGVTAGAAAQATELRKHEANDVKCSELGWLCIPLVVESYGAWGKEAMESFSSLASRLAITSSRPKSAVLSELYGRLNLNLVRANMRAIMSRYCPQDYF